MAEAGASVAVLGCRLPGLETHEKYPNMVPEQSHSSASSLALFSSLQRIGLRMTDLRTATHYNGAVYCRFPRPFSVAPTQPISVEPSFSKKAFDASSEHVRGEMQASGAYRRRKL